MRYGKDYIMTRLRIAGAQAIQRNTKKVQPYYLSVLIVCKGPLAHTRNVKKKEIN